LKAGDKITHINNKPIVEKSPQEIIDNIRGIEGEFVNLTVEKKSTLQTQEIELKRSSVSNPTAKVFSKNDIIFAQIHSFEEQTPAEIKRKMLNEIDFLANELKGIVIDLRGNKGGILERGIETADLFLNDGIILKERGRNKASRQKFGATIGDIAQNAPIVIITDKNTASSAEILAIALRDNLRGVIVGSPTYGKQTVQKLISLKDDSQIALTWAKYYSPKNSVINKFGILPNICITSSMTPVLPILSKKNRKRISKIENRISQTWFISKDEFKAWSSESLTQDVAENICPKRIIAEPETAYKQAINLIKNKNEYIKALNNSIFSK
jgi:carboxyl-terminal processing protease